MYTTSATLLARLRAGRNDADWRRFVELYSPLLFFWARRTGLAENDAADLVQEVFVILLEKLHTFEAPTEARDGQFRAWLRTVTLRKWGQRARRRTEQPLAGDDPGWSALASPDQAEEIWREEYNRMLLRRALELMRDEFCEAHFRACWETTVGGRSAGEVATELGMSVGALHVAKSRVIKRVREELLGLLET